MATKILAPILDLKDLSENGAFEGYASTFGNKDSGGDIVVAGAFGQNLAEHRQRGTKVRMYWQHNSHEPIGRWIDLAEDGKGLYVKGQLNMGVQRAREAHALLKEGDIDGLSIGYSIIESEPDKGRSALLLKKIRLHEVSVVSQAMNDRARVDAVKAEDQVRAAFQRGETPELKLVEEYLRDGGFPGALATDFVSRGKAAFRRSDSGDEAKNLSRFFEALKRG